MPPLVWPKYSDSQIAAPTISIIATRPTQISRISDASGRMYFL